MYQFTGGAGSPPGYQNPQALSYNGQQSHQYHSYPQARSTSQPYEFGFARQNVLRPDSASALPYQACYNCGGSDHWAQNCPEPRREVPAGLMNSQRPYKRQKFSGSIITKYPAPPTPINPVPYNQQLHAPRKGFTHPPSAHTLHQYAGPPTPVSANTNLPGPGQQHTWPPTPLFHHHSQQWSSQGLPTQSGVQASQRTGSMSSSSSGQKPHGFPSQTHEQQHLPASTPSVRHGSFDRHPQESHQKKIGDEQASSLSWQDGRKEFQQSEVSKRDVEEEQEEESWWEELRALDYSERSQETTHFVSHPANPVAEPLPCTMRDEDLVARLPIAASLPAGIPVSRYFRNLSAEDFMRNSFEGFEEGEDVVDSALAMPVEEGEAISKDELIARRREILATRENTAHGGEMFREYDLGESAYPDIAQESEDHLDPSDGLPTPCQSQESEDERQAREQEERLAALGVTGFAKPVRTSVRRSIVPATPASSEDRETLTACDLHGLPGASNSTKEQRPNPFNDAEWEGYRGSGSPPGSHFASSLQTPPASTCHDSHSDHTEIGTRRLSSYGAQSTLTDSPGYAKRVQSVAPDPGMWKLALSQGERNRNVPTPTYTAGVVTRGEEYRSPSESHSDQGLRRKPSMREFSAEVDGGPKRQKDKGHQKDRRKAPKVAAAYSRRW